MDKIVKNSISEQLALQIKQKDLSQRKYAKILGISDAQLSNILTGNWDKISEKMWNTVRAALGHYDTQNGWPLIRTRNFAAVHNVCKDAKRNKRMLGIIGATGYGKTKALNQYASNTPNTGYVLCDFLMTQKSFLVSVARSFGLDSNGTKLQLMNRVTEKMNQMGDALLILDDLGKVNDRIYRIIQLFYDRTEGNAGIVVSGVHFLKNYLDRSAQRDKMGFRELKSRIEYWQELSSPMLNEVKAMAANYGIEDSTSVKYIARKCTNFRTVRSMIQNAVRAAEGEEISLDVLESINIQE